MLIVGRNGWGAQPPESVTPWNVADLDGICQHWFGSPKAADAHAGCDDLLRSVQRSHMAGEYNDIAYNFGVCPHGVAYELRGWHRQTGANGTGDANRRFLAIVYMAGVGDPLTAKGAEALEELYAEAFAKGVGVKAITHGSITGSECPGPAVRAWLASGAWKPKPAPQLDMLAVLTGEGRTMAESGAFGQKEATQKEKIRAFLSSDRVVDAMYADFEHDKERGEPEDVRVVRRRA